MKRLILCSLAALLCGCGAHYIPDEVLEAAANEEAAGMAAKGAPVEEQSAELREEVLDAIQDQMSARGVQPRTVVNRSELISLTRAPRSQATINSRVSYIATVRLNFKSHHEDARYLVSERDGRIVVRKISL